MNETGWVGILAVQGGVAPHEEALRAVGIESRRVVRPDDLDGASGLILPGGESTAQAKLLAGEDGALEAALSALHGRGAPILATCAGLILAAEWGWLAIEVVRNGWGRQIDSFEALADDGETRLVCIRAPRIERVVAPTQVLLTLGGEAIRVRQGHVVGATDHPELTSDRRLHAELFGNGEDHARGSGSGRLRRGGPAMVVGHAGHRSPRRHL